MIALAAVAFVALACGGGSSKSTNKALSSDYYGAWTASDGTTLRITSDGLGYYKSGGTSIDGAAAEMDESGKLLKLSFLGVSVKEFKIDQAPSGGKMKLDGVNYQTSDAKGGSSSDDDDKKKSDDSDVDTKSNGDVPSKSVLNSMIKDISEKFNDAVQDEDFSDLRDEYASEVFKKQISAEKMKDIFKDFIAQKSGFDKHFNSMEDLEPSYDPEPKVTKEEGEKVMQVEGTYPTSPVTKFTFKFIDEKGEWKLLQLKYNIGK
jgi:hypothetical protein